MRNELLLRFTFMNGDDLLCCWRSPSGVTEWLYGSTDGVFVYRLGVNEAPDTTEGEGAFGSFGFGAYGG